MFNKLELMVNNFSYSNRADLISIIESMRSKYSDMDNLTGWIKKYRNDMKDIKKHSQKKTNTDKWNKRWHLIQENLNNSFGRTIMILNSAHHMQTLFFRILYSIEYKVKLQDTPSSYHELITTIDIFDSTDKERYMTFNKVRNVLSHAPTEQVANEFIKEGLAEEFIDLCLEIKDINSAILQAKHKVIYELIYKEIDIAFKNK